ncbi:Probable RNA-directed DNA polymerase from transposon X-element [Eumeta japonica]|uniref:Probable RNA-directed DNA polymerase from transposon X-element n=1 Tax=Eumeta variegata TaxID=151549 RepID=A0A4C1WNM0_EUMVA|nr:Probable RNA-directed DNA polymerase from transposon X-element [Eumeta japonica]
MASWKRFCSAQDGEEHMGRCLQGIRDTRKSRQDVLLKDDSGRVCNPDESADLLADTFFPDGQATASHRTSAILREPKLFLAVAHKCLRLGYFPRAWKVAVIKVIPKPGKDDYSCPKSYRPMGLLFVMGKTVERMLVSRIKCHIVLKL